MKKIIITCEIILVVFILAKIVAIGGVIIKTDVVDRFLSVRPAFAELPGGAVERPVIKDVCVDRLLKESELMTSLMKRKEELDRRETDLLNEKQNLTVLKREILTRIEQLQELEGRLSVLVESIKEVDGKKYQDLAKIYETFPPAHAGSMLEQLDTETAAAIIMNMRSKKAGAVWEHMKSKRALEITKEITNRQLSAAGPDEQQ